MSTRAVAKSDYDPPMSYRIVREKDEQGVTWQYIEKLDVISGDIATRRYPQSHWSRIVHNKPSQGGVNRSGAVRFKTRKEAAAFIEGFYWHD